MDFQELKVSEMVTLFALIVTALSLTIGLIPLLRDRARINFNLYVAEFGLSQKNRFIKAGDYYAFRIVNSGRRPVTITHVGGVTSEAPFFSYWFWRLTGLFPPQMFVIDDPGLNSLLKDANGNDRTLKEGEYSIGSIKINLSLCQKHGGIKARQFHVIDSLGKYHRLPYFAHRKLNKTVGELLSQNEKSSEKNHQKSFESLSH